MSRSQRATPAEHKKNSKVGAKQRKDDGRNQKSKIAKVDIDVSNNMRALKRRETNKEEGLYIA